ncbi:nicotinate phosphoribosyltransferase [Spiroplasma endosymbiont of Anurida maritima]|uniref:nicotinate phosphoribosyltransferase n=1 Tax=Spiroplasma endosymbiont of Anurida maritima TaxID=2967972 RepID=UPI0036D3DA72
MNKIDLDKYCSKYFNKTVEILEKFNQNNQIVMQFFQREDNVVLSGIDYCVDLLKSNISDFSDIEIWALKEGAIINAGEPVLKICGPYHKFAKLENVIDGVLSRKSSVATNSKRVLDAANGKSVIYMNDRNDYYFDQAEDAHAAYIGGFRSFVTNDQVSKLPEKLVPIGTIPHALIQNFGGDLIKCLSAYKATFPKENLIALVDYHNNVIREALSAAKNFPELFAVRVDTSISLIDAYFMGKEYEYNGKNIHGVNEHLIRALRKELDNNGYKNVKIIASSGFDASKIDYFEKSNVPVDIYGVGQWLTNKVVNFTGDAVILNGKDEAKLGRQNVINNNLVKVI